MAIGLGADTMDGLTWKAYNMTATVVKDFLHLPYRFLNHVSEGPNEIISPYNETQVSNRTETKSPMPLKNDSRIFPGPFGFIMSGYAIVLLILGFVLYQIHHTVVPLRDGQNLGRHIRPPSFFGRLHARIFPTDMSRTRTRAIVHLPTVYYMGKSLLLWTIILLQTSQTFPQTNWTWLQRIAIWAMEKKMSDICWSTLCTISAAFVVEAFVRGLSYGPPNSNSTPFNMVAYAFLLYFCSLGAAHSLYPEGLPSRPDVHVIYTMTVPLLQLFILHVLSISLHHSTHRLLPTFLTSFLSLLHFYYVAFISQRSTIYPVVGYTPVVFESLLIGVTAVTVSLNALTQLVVNGNISQPLLANRSNGGINYEEDFSIVLLKMGTASLQATSLAGLGNQVSSISGYLKPKPVIPKTATEYGKIDISPAGVTEVKYGKRTVVSKGRQKSRTFALRGWWNEVRDIEPRRGKPHMVPGEGILINISWFRVFLDFVRSIWAVIKGAGKALWQGSWKMPEQAASAAQDIPLEDDQDEDLYKRFLMGETFSDSEEEESEYDELEDVHEESGLESDQGSEDPLSEPSSSDEMANSDTAGLLADLAPTPAAVLVAHMADERLDGQAAMTRRRYSALVKRARLPTEDDSGNDIASSSNVDRERPAGGNGLTNCVICTTDARQIICWPCRCLALCDECRGILASRSAASHHACPCCRQPVKGYSKIYIP